MTIIPENPHYREMRPKSKEIYLGLMERLNQDPDFVTVKQKAKSSESQNRSTNGSSLTKPSDLASSSSSVSTPSILIPQNSPPNAHQTQSIQQPNTTFQTPPSDSLAERFAHLRVDRKKDHYSSPSSLSPVPSPLNLHYRLRTPSPPRSPPAPPPTAPLAPLIEKALAEHGQGSWLINPVALSSLLRDFPQHVLLIDVRYRREFNASHIKTDNVVCIEPFVVLDLISESGLSDSLMVSPEREQHLFARRARFELVVLYDGGFVAPRADIQSVSALPRPLLKLVALLSDRAPLAPLKRRAVVLNGGFKTWKSLYRNEITLPQEEPLFQPQKLVLRGYSPEGSPSYEITPPIQFSPKIEKSPAPYSRNLEDVFELKKKSLGVNNLNIDPPQRALAMSLKSPSPTIPQPINKPFKVDFACGLANLGNSCYINCVLQCLSGTAQLTSVFLSGQYRRYINVNSRIGSKGVLANCFYETLKLMLKKDGGYIVPNLFKQVCGLLNLEFRGTEQQDCQEFLNFLLDGLHEDLNQCGGHPHMKPLTDAEEERREQLPCRLASAIEWERYLKTEFSALVDIFQGQYLSRLRCLKCGHTLTTYQAFSTLSLPIPDGSKVSLYDCFEEFTKEELLDGDDRWRCPKCKEFTRSTKQLRITRLPKVLILHLKRFKQGFGLLKLDTLVTYPIEGIIDLDRFWPKVESLDELRKLAQFSSRGQVPPFRYSVYGVVNHSGTLRGGHYTAYVKGRGGWRYFDDTRVKSAGGIVGKDNYLIFLERV